MDTALDSDFIKFVNAVNTPAQYVFGRRFQLVAPNMYDPQAIEKKTDSSIGKAFIYGFLMIPSILIGQLIKLIAYIFCPQYRLMRQLVDLGIKMGFRVEWLPPPVVGPTKGTPAG